MQVSRQAGVPFEHVRCTLDVNPRMARDVVRAVRRRRPDLLHTHLVHADIYGATAARLTGVPFVSTRHNDDRYLLGPFRYVDRTFASGARRLIAISDAVRQFLVAAGLPAAKFETIHYGLDEMPSRAVRADAGAGGRAGLRSPGARDRSSDRAEGPRDAAARVRRRAGEATRCACSRSSATGRSLPRRTRSCASSDWTGAVVLPGRLETRDWLERADVFVHTSRWEGFGIVLLEAMLAGLPIVATRVSAVPEIVADGETGLLVEAGDSSGLSLALGELLADPRTRAGARDGRAGAGEVALLDRPDDRGDARRLRPRLTDTRVFP